MKYFKRGKGEKVLLMIDNYNILANGCDSASPELDLLETANEMLSYAMNDDSTSVALGINRDLIPQNSLEAAFYRELKNSGDFGLVFELSRNLAGYSKDVRGQLNVIQYINQSIIRN